MTQVTEQETVDAESVRRWLGPIVRHGLPYFTPTVVGGLTLQVAVNGERVTLMPMAGTYGGQVHECHSAEHAAEMIVKLVAEYNFTSGAVQAAPLHAEASHHEHRRLVRAMANVGQHAGPGVESHGFRFRNVDFTVYFRNRVPDAVVGAGRHFNVLGVEAAAASIVTAVEREHRAAGSWPRMPMTKASVAAVVAEKLGLKREQVLACEQQGHGRVTVYVDAEGLDHAGLVAAQAVTMNAAPIGTAVTVVRTQFGPLRALGAVFEPRAVKEVVAAALPYAPADLHRAGYMAALVGLTECEERFINVFAVPAIIAALRAVDRAIADYQRRTGSTLHARWPLAAGLVLHIEAAVDETIAEPSTYWFVSRASTRYLREVTR